MFNMAPGETWSVLFLAVAMTGLIVQKLIEEIGATRRVKHQSEAGHVCACDSIPYTPADGELTEDAEVPA